MNLNLENLRREYLRDGLRRDQLASDPIEQFERWMAQMVAAEISDPNAMTIATVDASGQPSQRIVLLKGLDQRGFVFYTNLRSHKAQDLKQNPKISLHFPWHCLERQVKVCGVAQQMTAAESLKYFLSRPRESQLAAWASNQSRPISSRAMLMQQFEAMKNKFSKGEIPLPDFWGGFRVKPEQIEFWQGGAHRLHDRFQYTRQADDSWEIARLEP
jgi:pyridoxamine 5'-phosphate oxidase